MPTVTPEQLDAEEREGAEDLKQDLGMLSCFAGAEIDRAMRGEKGPTYEYVALLKQKLESWIPSVEQNGSRSLADSKTMVAIAMALPEISPRSQLNEVVEKAKGMATCLGGVLDACAGDESPNDEDALRQVMGFCLNLSGSLRSIGYPPDVQTYLSRTKVQEQG